MPKCYGCGNPGKARDIGGTVYYMCDDCYQTHVERNDQAVVVARQCVEAEKVAKGVNNGMINSPERNKDYARQVLKNQVDVAFNTALALENADMPREAESQLAVALAYEESLARLEAIPVELCVPDVPLNDITV